MQCYAYWVLLTCPNDLGHLGALTLGVQAPPTT